MVEDDGLGDAAGLCGADNRWMGRRLSVRRAIGLDRTPHKAAHRIRTSCLLLSVRVRQPLSVGCPIV